MGSRRTRVSHAAGVVTAALALLLLDVALRSTIATYEVGGGVGFVAAGLASVGLFVGNCFEARLTAVVVAGVTGLLALLGVVLGPPGSTGGTVTLRGLLLVCCGIAVPLLLVRDARHRPGVDSATRPYAP